MSNDNAQAALLRRLAPLYFAVFCQGFVLWYATEKLFMTSIGFNSATIGVMVAVYSVVIILAETPSGILADRWSRKGVLILAALALAISGLIGGLSDSIPVFLASTCFWGLFFALYSGTYDSIIYDTLLETDGNADKFERFLGIMKSIEGSALVLGALLGGLIAQFIGLRETYLFTIPVALLSIVALLIFKEPRLHKTEVTSPIFKHIQETLSAVLRRKSLLPILVVLVTTAVLTYTILEFSQVWLIALAVPLFLYGPVDALMLAGYGLGGASGGRLHLNKKPILLTIFAVAVLSSLGLSLIHNIAFVVLCLVLIILCLTLITIFFTKQLHDNLNSNIRAGAASAVSSLGRIVIVPVVLLFGFVSQRMDVFNASWVLVFLILIVGLFALISHKESN